MNYKFRGRCVETGEWRYGSLNLCSGGKIAFISNTNVSPEAQYAFTYEVDPDTIGQYTGVKDVTRTKEIYTGDIVQAPRKCKTPCVVKFKMHCGYFADGTGGVHLTGFCLDESLWMGNIYENPEIISDYKKNQF